MEQTAEFLMQGDQDAILRFTQVRRTEGVATDAAGLTVDWSYSPFNAQPVLSTASLGEIRGKLPLLDLGAALIVVEMRADFYAGMPEIGFGKVTFRGGVSSLPRFAQQFAITGTGTSTCL